ncbi:MAG: hypothetical protein JXR63_12380 [Spirochaetales bacterium]|nr:hypothetical protein [Spirochaetales bacterium]
MIRKFSHIPDLVNFKNSEDFRCILSDFSTFIDGDPTSALFLGPKGENLDILESLVLEAIDSIKSGRTQFHPEDNPIITDNIKESELYKKSLSLIRENFTHLLRILNKYDTPFYSSRYIGHMNWELSIPALSAYFATMLHNPNNVTVQASTATTFLEMSVGRDICSMIGYDDKSWSHITCDGSVANLEALWAAREVKLLAIAIKNAIVYEDVLKGAKFISVEKVDRSTASLLQFSTWELLNLSREKVLELPRQVGELCNIEESEVWDLVNKKYSCNAIGFAEFSRKNLEDYRLLLVVPATRHYSWDKASSILGFGSVFSSLSTGINTCFVRVPIDEKSRIDIEEYQSLMEHCSDEKNKCSVVLSVAVVGTTEEASVDPVAEILACRNRLRLEKSFDIPIHVDAAYGGYSLSTIREDFPLSWPLSSEEPSLYRKKAHDFESSFFSEYVQEQLQSVCECDSVTIDPHKWGYIPYGAGSLSYSNGKIINCLTFGASYIGKPGLLPSVGDYGVEGSKPGASAAAVFLSHSVIRPSKTGYGRIINESVLSSKLFYLSLFSIDEDAFFVQTLTPLVDSRVDIFPILEYMQDFKKGEIKKDITIGQTIRNLGPDMNMVDYCFNFYIEKNGQKIPNSDWELMNKFNSAIYEKLHVKEGFPTTNLPLIISMTSFEKSEYGEKFIGAFSGRLGLSVLPEKIDCLRSTIMDPWLIYPDSEGKNFVGEVIIPSLVSTVREVVLSITQYKP